MQIKLPTNIIGLLTLEKFLFVVLIFSFFLFILFSVLKLIVMFQKSIRRVEKRQVNEADTALEEALKILEDSRLQSMNIIRDAHKEAVRVVDQAKNVSDDVRTSFIQKADELVSTQILELTRIRTDLSSGITDTIKEKIDEDVEGIHRETKAIETKLHEVSDRVPVEIEAHIKNQLNKIDDELENYRKERLDKINSRISTVVAEVLEDELSVLLGDPKNEPALVRLITEKFKSLDVRR